MYLFEKGVQSRGKQFIVLGTTQSPGFLKLIEGHTTIRTFQISDFFFMGLNLFQLIDVQFVRDQIGQVKFDVVLKTFGFGTLTAEVRFILDLHVGNVRHVNCRLAFLTSITAFHDEIFTKNKPSFLEEKGLDGLFFYRLSPRRIRPLLGPDQL
jgi:hypothetical protein